MDKTEDQGLFAIQSTELLFLESELSGLGGRALAYSYDLTIRALISAIILFIAFMYVGRDHHGLFLLAMSFLGTFNFFYPILFEAVWAGKTPGKHLAGIRVIKRDGTRISLLDALLRNVMRIADMLPMGYLVGLCVIFFDKQNRRVGDLLADTIVVYDRAKFRTIAEYLDKQLITAQKNPDIFIGGIERLGNAERTIIKDLCVRIDHLEPAEKQKILEKFREIIVSRLEVRGTGDLEVLLYEIFKRL
jgi:uncharacterized RDD family membrane protein YckC